MARVVTKVTYLERHITVLEDAPTAHTVIVTTDFSVNHLFIQSDIASDSAALLVGKAWVDGCKWQSIRTTPAEQSQRGILMPAVLSTIAGLVSDGDGENPEYDRALVEVTGTLLGLDLGDDAAREAVLAMLRAMA